MSVLCLDTAVKILQGEPVSRFINFRDEMEETRDFNYEEIEEFYNPSWSDDVVGPVFIPDEQLAELGYLAEPSS
jgi:hypothetical protein